MNINAKKDNIGIKAKYINKTKIPVIISQKKTKMQNVAFIELLSNNKYDVKVINKFFAKNEKNYSKDFSNYNGTFEKHIYALTTQLEKHEIPISKCILGLVEVFTPAQKTDKAYIKRILLSKKSKQNNSHHKFTKFLNKLSDIKDKFILNPKRKYEHVDSEIANFLKNIYTEISTNKNTSLEIF